MHRDLILVQSSEVFRKRQHAVSRDGKCDALGGEEATGGGTRGIDPEERQDGDSAVRTDELNEVRSPVVGVGSRHYAVEILDAEQDDDECRDGENPGGES